MGEADDGTALEGTTVGKSEIKLGCLDDGVDEDGTADGREVGVLDEGTYDEGLDEDGTADGREVGALEEGARDDGLDEDGTLEGPAVGVLDEGACDEGRAEGGLDAVGAALVGLDDGSAVIPSLYR